MDPQKHNPKTKSSPSEDAIELTPEKMDKKKANKEASETAHSEFEQLKDNKDVEGLINFLKNTEYQYLAKYAISALYDIGDEKAIPALIDEALKGNHGIAARENAVRALGDIGKHNVVESLIYLMGKGSLVRRVAAQALGKIKDDKVVEPLNMVVCDENEDHEFREDAVEALGEIATTKAITRIISYLGSDISEKTLSVLKKVGKPATAPLLKILETTSNEDDWNCSLRQPVLIALALIKDADAVEPLIKAINYNTLAGDSDYTFQNWIIFALGDIGDKRATKPLIQLMRQNGDNLIRGTTAAALGKIGDKQAIEPLLRILENERENSGFRDNAAWALLQLDDEKTAIPLLRYLKGNHSSIFSSLKNVSFPSEFQNTEGTVDS